MNERFIAVAIAVCAAFSGACTFREVTSVADLKAGQKVIVGDVRFVDRSASSYPGKFDRLSLALSYRLPVHDGQVVLRAGSGEIAWDEGTNDVGGAFRIGIDDRTAYLLMLRRSATPYAFESFIPLLVTVSASDNACEFIGTIRVEVDGEETRVAVIDDFDDFRSAHPNYVAGCKLQKAIAHVVTAAERLEAIREAARAEPPQPMVKDTPDGRRTCRDRQDFDEHRNCILAAPAQ
jgi:hypothetical protein